MENLKKSFNSNGTFLPELFFVNEYNKNPIKLSLSLNSKLLNRNELINDLLINDDNWVFSGEYNAGFNENEINNLNSYSSELNQILNLSKDLTKYKSTLVNFLLINTKEHLLIINTYFICDDGISIYYDKDYTNISVIADLIEKIKYYTYEKSKNMKINLICSSNSGYYLNESEVSNKYKVDLNKHYNDDFKTISKNINEFIINEKESGLIILHGVPGSGKTNYIRHLICNSDKKFIILNNNLMNHLSEPSFISFLLEHKDSILIIEDCEQLLKDREENMFQSGISNILNMTDGMFSDIFNIKIIATFNSDLEKIDKALLRNGRLIEKYNFNKLSLEKTNKLLKEIGLPESDHEMTLADIYNYNEEKELIEKPTKKIGF